ncbi:MAG: hypothetical protein AB1640_20440 [bacterium]
MRPRTRAPYALRSWLAVFLACSLLVGLAVPAACAEQGDSSQGSEVRTVPSQGPSLAETEREEAGWSYNTDYVFAVSRAVRDSTIAPAGKVPLFILSIPVDVALLPFSLLAGLFGA